MGDQYRLDFCFILESLANSVCINCFAPLEAERDYLRPKLLSNRGKAFTKNTIKYG